MCLSAALLVACARGNNGLPTLDQLALSPQSQRRPLASSGSHAVKMNTATEAVLYSFCSIGPSCQDGSYPLGGLVIVNGTLYGTTYYGGDRGQGLGFGTVYGITTGGTYSQLYSFAGAPKHGPDGANPLDILTNMRGTFYGATFDGGASGDGIIFSITKSGVYHLLHSFNESDGIHPNGTLTNMDGTFYGTTHRGGAKNGHGTVFTITGSGAYNKLFTFTTEGKDGCPNPGLINVGGVLYGTTSGCNTRSYDGAVFKITTSGSETLIHHFGTGSDGAEPQAGLTNVGGVLYGTTSRGGVYGNGTVFKITTAGTETVLYSFRGGTDGAQPRARLTNVRRTLYGTTFLGGSTSGFGTVFKITTSGKETVLYRFAAKPDASGPDASLINVGGTLYGTTVAGGASNNGTIFSLSGF